MRFVHKLVLVIAALVLLILTPYFVWGDRLDAYFASPEYQRWLVSVKPYAWLMGIALLIGDLVLPIPTPPVMATLGTLYGSLVGGLIASAGSVLAGLTAYGLARGFGSRGIRLLADDDELARFRAFFDSWGTAGIIASRALPVVPEIMTLLAGAARMHFGRFLLALVIGSLPVGLLLAWAGAQAGSSSELLLVLTLIPAGLWCVYLGVMSRRARRAEAAG
jgi:uncharacterized membrane protein YdjX (TVP38/TMEM64 family)